MPRGGILKPNGTSRRNLCVVCGVELTGILKHMRQHELKGEFVDWDAYREMNRKRKSASMTGNKNGVGPRAPHSEEQNRAHAAAMRGRKQTPESNAKRSASHKARWARMTPAEREQWMEQSIPSGNYPSSIEKVVATVLDDMCVNYESQHWIHIIGDGERHSFRPDFLIPSQGLVIEVNGCYWHGCDPCFGSRALQKHVAGDERRREILQDAGYSVAWIWEHDIKSGAFLSILEEILDRPILEQSA